MRSPAALVVTTVALSFLVFCNTEPRKAPPEPLEPAVSEPLMASASASAPEPQPELLFTFQTFFKSGPKYEGRVANIKKIARMLNGIHIHPGETFSFNRVVGPRTLEAGFLEAPTYFLGEVLPGVGGGVCQVSSTMYAAALHANVEVIDRRPHSRASNYIEPGLDATVNYPPECYDNNGPVAKPDKRVCYDFKFRNPYDFDLIFKLSASDTSVEKDKGVLIVWVQGTGKIPKVKTKWAAYGAPPFDIRYRTVSWWKDDRKKLKQSGRPGLRGARLLTIEHLDGKVEKKSVPSKYMPVPEVFEVGVEFDAPEETPSEEEPTDG